jgi:hypothetical protein
MIRTKYRQKANSCVIESQRKNKTSNTFRRKKNNTEILSMFKGPARRALVDCGRLLP